MISYLLPWLLNLARWSLSARAENVERKFLLSFWIWKYSRKSLKKGKWLKIFGKNLNETKIGIIGFGRIGSEILKLLKAFHCKDILINDVNLDKKKLKKYSAKQATKNTIFRNCNLITIHLPITKKTKNLVSKKEIAMMRNDTILINTSRGGIINEDHLYDALKKKGIYLAA